MPPIRKIFRSVIVMFAFSTLASCNSEIQTKENNSSLIEESVSLTSNEVNITAAFEYTFPHVSSSDIVVTDDTFELTVNPYVDSLHSKIVVFDLGGIFIAQSIYRDDKLVVSGLPQGVFSIVATITDVYGSTHEYVFIKKNF